MSLYLSSGICIGRACVGGGGPTTVGGCWCSGAILGGPPATPATLEVAGAWHALALFYWRLLEFLRGNVTNCLLGPCWGALSTIATTSIKDRDPVLIPSRTILREIGAGSNGRSLVIGNGLEGEKHPDRYDLFEAKREWRRRFSASEDEGGGGVKE